MTKDTMTAAEFREYLKNGKFQTGKKGHLETGKLSPEYLKTLEVNKESNEWNRLNIKPLSINEGYSGKKYKTEAHREWHKKIMVMLPEKNMLPSMCSKIFDCRKLEIHLKFGFATGASDLDNCVKFFQDCLATKYSFNDKLIFKAVIEKEIVGKGNEYIEWELLPIFEF